MTIQPIGGNQTDVAGLQSASQTKSSQGGGTGGAGAAGSSQTVVSTVSTTGADGSTTTITTYADGSTQTTVTPAVAGAGNSPNLLDGQNGGQLGTLLAAQEQANNKQQG